MLNYTSRSRVILLFGDYPPAPTGWATVNYHLVKALREEGFTVFVVTHIAGMPLYYTFDRVHVIGGFKGRFEKERIERILKSFNPTIVILSGTWFLWHDVVGALAELGIPFVAYTVTESFVNAQYIDFLAFAERVFVPTNYVKELFQGIIPSRKLEVMPFGIDPNIFKPLFEPRDIIYCPARLNDRRKNTDIVIEAFLRVMDRIPTFKLIISGYIEKVPSYKGRIEGTWSNEIFTPLTKLPSIMRLPVLYSMSKVVVSVGKAEGFSLPIIEAWACCRPVIAIDVPPYNEIIPDKDLLVRPEYTCIDKVDVIMGGTKVPVVFKGFIPSVEDLSEKLVYVIEHYDEFKPRWNSLRLRVLKYYNYETAYRPLIELIKEFVLR